MSLEGYALFAEIVAAFSVVVSLLYLAAQVRQSNRVSSASARQAISEFALQMSIFNAEHADRLAKVHSQAELTEGDHLFRWWNHMMVFLHAETYYRHHELGLMPPAHWDSYVRFVDNYLDTAGVSEFWTDVGQFFSMEFSVWVRDLIQKKTDNPGADHRGGMRSN